jgi:hypothetical protein
MEDGAAAPASPEAAQAVTVDLHELNDSGLSGTATLTDNGDGTTTVELAIDGPAGDNPAHIHEGTCDSLDPNPLYPLNNVDADGSSVIDLDVPLDELLGGEFAINVHKSAAEIAVYVTCGNIS